MHRVWVRNRWRLSPMCYSNNLFAEHLRKLAMSSWELQFPGCVPVLCRTKVPPYLFLVAPVILSYQWPTSDVIDERTPAYSSCKVELVLDLSLGETPERISDGSGRNGSFMPALPRGGMWWRRRRRCARPVAMTSPPSTRNVGQKKQICISVRASV
jgi:hypothetical protein